jgi:glycosyltransferase involved in cell wall biosynthesis
VSIIVPARNEARNLPRLLPTLLSQAYPDFEVLVVDDASTDETAALAARAGARVLSTSGPPPGWTGKCNACWQGAQAARGEWLLFVDADTTHTPLTLASAIAWAAAQRAEAASFILRLECRTFWERLPSSTCSPG